MKAERISTHWYKGKTRISDVKGGVMSKLNLRVIAKIFYDQELEYDQKNVMNGVASSGHPLTFSEAINAVLSNLATLFGMPKWLLGSSQSWCLYCRDLSNTANREISFRVT